MTLHDRLVHHFGRARQLWSKPPEVLFEHPVAKPEHGAVHPHPAASDAHHAPHLDRRTNKSTRPVANHHPHRKD